MLLGPAAYELTLTGTLTAATTAIAAIFTGVSRAAFEEGLTYIRQRVQGGKPLASISSSSGACSTCSVGSRRLARCRATMIYNHTSPTPSLENAIAGRLPQQAAFEVANDAVELCGAAGLSEQSLVERLFRDTRMALIEDGNNES